MQSSNFFGKADDCAIVQVQWRNAGSWWNTNCRKRYPLQSYWWGSI